MPGVPIEVVWLIAAVALLVIAVAVLVLALSVVGLVREARSVVRAGARTMAVIESELPPTLKHLRDLAARLDATARDLPPRLERLDGLLEEGELTLAAVRSSAEAAEDIARAPREAVDRVGRGLRSLVTRKAPGSTGGESSRSNPAGRDRG
jgi:uncharacterized protein YoxC